MIRVSSGQKNIIRWSRLVQVLCVGWILMMCYGLAMFWLSAERFDTFLTNRAEYVGIADNFTKPALWPQILGIKTFSSIPMIIFCAIASLLFFMFGRTAKGRVMVEVNAKALIWVGILLFAVTLIGKINHSVLTILMTLHNPVGQRMMSFGIDSGDFGNLVAGFVCLSLGMIWKEAIMLEDEAWHIV